MDANTNPFGTWLKATRSAQGISMEDLALRVPCAFETIRKMESGTRKPSRQMAALIAKALGVADDDLPGLLDKFRLRDPSGE